MGRRVVRTAAGDVTISADSESLLDQVEHVIAQGRPDFIPAPAHTIGRLARAGRVTRLDDVAQTDADRKGPLFAASPKQGKVC